jgi:hypothetical protein
MKIILIIPCVLYFPVVVDAVDAADKYLRGSNRDLQFQQVDFGTIGSNDPFATLTPTNPTQPSLPFQFPGQPSHTPNNNAPILGDNLFTFPTNPGFLQPTGPADTPTVGGFFGSGANFIYGLMFGQPFLSAGSQTGIGSGDKIFPSPLFLGPPLQAPPGSGADGPLPTLPPGLGGELGFGGSTGSSGCRGRGSELVCIAVFDPVICEGGCRYGNSCEAKGAGFAANQCRPD